MGCFFWSGFSSIIFYASKVGDILMKNKKGELTTQQIVMLIILITSFIVILFFIFRLDLGKTTEKEICHNSVIMRGNSILGKTSPPLKCYRSYVCITEDGSCESMTNPEIKEVETKDDIYEVLAEEMAECWWMFGEGKINYVGEDMFSKLYCSICSQIAFDDSSVKIFPTGEIKKEEFYIYLNNNNYSEDEKYLTYFYGTNDLAKIQDGLKKQNINFGSIEITKQYFVLMGITSEIDKLSWIAAVGGAIALTPLVGGGWLLGGLTAINTAVIGGGAGAIGGSVLAFVIRGASGNDYIPPTIIEANSKAFDELGCKDITTLS